MWKFQRSGGLRPGTGRGPAERMADFDLPAAATLAEISAMRVRMILLISLVLNIALASMLLVWLKPAGRNAQRSVRIVAVTNLPSNGLRIIKTNVLLRPRAFAWQEVEAQDYPTYIENLRALGMPESTIRDIIIAEVDQLFVKKRRDEAVKQDMEWWRAVPSAQYQSNVLARAEALEEERHALLTKLLGENWQSTRADQQADPIPLPGPILGNLPDEVKQTVQQIAAASVEKTRAYLLAQEADGKPLDPLQMAQLREETRQQLAAVLTPQQLEEFLVRYSDNADRLRRDLGSIELSPDEFRQLFRSIDQIDRDLQLRFGGEDAVSRRERERLEQQRLAAMQEALGPERFQTFQMLHDPEYRKALEAAERAGASRNAASALYEINRLAAEEFERIRNDLSLTAAEQQQQMSEVQSEQQRALATILNEPLPEPAAPTAPAAPPLRAHVMEPGETLGQISLRYGVRIPAIREANPGVDINRLPPGAVINVPPANLPNPPLPPGLLGR